MIGQARKNQGARDFGDALAALVRAEGTAGHDYPTSDAMRQGRLAARNVADVVHHLCLLHGRHPGVVDHAAVKTVDEKTRAFLFEAADAFERERSVLTKLVVAVGPLPSTPGQAETETAVLAQNHAIEMLANSDRDGCATGAAFALIADWAFIRPILEVAGHRLSMDIPKSILPGPAAVLDIMRASPPLAARERATLFGAQQILAQHRGMWDLLEARALARGEY